MKKKEKKKRYAEGAESAEDTESWGMAGETEMRQEASKD
jgi:hypothetical protein